MTRVYVQLCEINDVQRGVKHTRHTFYISRLSFERMPRTVACRRGKRCREVRKPEPEENIQNNIQTLNSLSIRPDE